MVLGISTKSMAEESLSIPNWLVESELLENGDLTIKENITFRFNEDFNGVFRDISLDKTSGIQNIKISEISGNGEVQYKRVKDAKKGDYGVFIVSEDSDQNIVQIFSPSSDEEKTFRLSYTIKNVAIKYNDIGELYYKFLGSENETPIDKFTVEIKLPKDDVDNKVKIFAHGPLNGQVNRKTNNIIYMEVDNVPEDTFIEGRILFPTEFIPNSTNIVDKNNYSSILNEEESFQKQIEKKAARNAALKSLFENISIAVAAVEMILFILLLNRFKREKDIYRAIKANVIPEDCTPAVASYLITMTVGSNTIMATILDLFRKGFIEVDDGQEYSEKRKKLKDFTITKIKEVDNTLLSHEKHFMNWLFNKIGDGRAATTRDIENYSKNHESEFQSSYYDWQKRIKEDAINKGYYDKSTKKFGTFLIILSSITLILSFIALGFENLLGLIPFATSIMLLIYGIALHSRKSDYGYSQYKKWLEFKKHMKVSKNLKIIDDFTKYPIDISLIYALSLGVNKEIIRKFNIDNIHNNNQVHYQNNGWIYWYFIFAHDKNNSFSRSINKSFASNSSSGSGGGFSGGGGGGAGGGGAGGF